MVEESVNYSEQLRDALKKRKSWLESTELPRLKNELQAYHNAFYSLYKLMLSKGLLQYDPYKGDTKIEKLTVPDSSSFPDIERTAVLSIRLSIFDNQLDYLVNFFSSSADTIGLEKLKRINALVSYVDWEHLIPDEKYGSVTKGVAQICAEIKKNADSFATTLIAGSLRQLVESYGKIMPILEEIRIYQKETVKLTIREKVVQELPPEQRNDTASIKKKYNELFPGKYYYPDLVTELLAEDNGQNGQHTKDGILESLKCPDVAKGKEEQKDRPSPKEVLLDGLRILGQLSATIENIKDKFNENVKVLKMRQKTLWEKIVAFLRKIFNVPLEPDVFEIVYVDSAKGIKATESLYYDTFSKEILSKIEHLKVFARTDEAQAKKFQSLQNEELSSMLKRQIEDIQKLYRIMDALDDYFKANVDANYRDRIMGVKNELAAIKNMLVKCNQRCYEYASLVDEMKDEIKDELPIG
jgi:hypothetical protein